MSALNDNEAVLRRALRSAADAIEPHADGLERIRSRLRPRPRSLPAAWAVAVWTELVLRAPAGLQSAWARLADAAAMARDQLAPGPAARHGARSLPRRRPLAAMSGARSLRLLRPLAAMSAVLIVTAGAYIAFDAPQGFFTNSSRSQLGSGGGPPSGSRPGGNTGTSSTDVNGSIPGIGPGLGAPTSAPNCISATPKPKKSPGAPGITPPPGAPTDSPTPQPSGSPSASPSPTPTDAGSPSPDPSDGSTPPSGLGSEAPISGDSSSPNPGSGRVLVPSPSPTPTCGTSGANLRKRTDKASTRPDGTTTHKVASVTRLGGVNDKPAKRADQG